MTPLNKIKLISRPVIASVECDGYITSMDTDIYYLDEMFYSDDIERANCISIDDRYALYNSKKCVIYEPDYVNGRYEKTKEVKLINNNIPKEAQTVYWCESDALKENKLYIADVRVILQINDNNIDIPKCVLYKLGDFIDIRVYKDNCKDGNSYYKVEDNWYKVRGSIKNDLVECVNYATGKDCLIDLLNKVIREYDGQITCRDMWFTGQHPKTLQKQHIPQYIPVLIHKIEDTYSVALIRGKVIIEFICDLDIDKFRDIGNHLIYSTVTGKLRLKVRNDTKYRFVHLTDIPLEVIQVDNLPV